MRRPRATVAICIAAAVLWGCAPRAYLAGEFAGMLDSGMGALEADDDLELLEKAFPANIKLLEALLVNSPEDKRLLTLLSRLYGSYAFAFLEPGLERNLLASEGCEPVKETPNHHRPPPTRETLTRYYQKGMDYGMRALEAAHPGWGKALSSASAAGDPTASLNPGDAPALFWYGFNLGAYVRLNFDSIRAVAMAPVIQSAMERVLTLDPDYYYGLAHLVLLAYHARSPAIGGDPETALLHYEKIRKATGADFLLADVYYARYYLYQKQDRSEFQATLQGVLERPRQQVPHALLDEVARRRARIYLDAVDCLFI